MRILLSTLLVLLLAPVHAYAGFCGKGELQVDFIGLYDANASNEKVRIYGAVETPRAGYAYSLLIKPGAPEGVVMGVLSLHEKKTHGVSAAVISEIEIDQSFDLPFGASAIMIDVVKRFNWGPEYFKGDLKERQSICLSPEKYKK